MRCKFQQNPPHSFWATAVLKMEQKFPIWKSRLSSSYTKNISYSLCSSGRRLHGHTFIVVVEHATVELLGQWCSGRSNATPRWDAVSSGGRRESCYGRCVAGERPTPHSPRDLGQGYWAATATVRWNMVYCETKTPRCHQLGEPEHYPVGKWRSLLLQNESPAEVADRARRR